MLVTDGEQRAALAVVRSLGAAGYRCIVTHRGESSLAGRSRHAALARRVPDALREPAGFADAIATLVAREKVALVLPIAEPAMLALLARRERLAPAVIPFPDISVFRALCDKERLLAEGASLGIATPAQVVVRDRAAGEQLDMQALGYPIVLKPARSVGEDSSGRVKLTVRYALDASALRDALAELPAAAYPLLLQQRIVGPGTGIFLMLWNGRVRAAFAHRRRCEKPPSGGVSVYRESIALDEHLLDRSRALLERFDWHGVAMIEFKRDERTGQPYLMEVNGRFWGSLQLAIDAGVDFPRLLADAALQRGSCASTAPAYRVGVRSRWLWGQVDHLIGRIPSRARGPVPPDTISVARAIGDIVLGPFRSRDYEEVLRWNDMAPFVEETLRWVRARA